MTLLFPYSPYSFLSIIAGEFRFKEYKASSSGIFDVFMQTMNSFSGGIISICLKIAAIVGNVLGFFYEVFDV